MEPGLGFKLLPVRIEGMDGLDKRGVFACHDHVNGVEVFSTEKAPGQVGFWISSCLKLTAERAEESKLAFADLGRQFQSLLDQCIDGDVIAQFKQFVLGKAFHGSSSLWLSIGWPGCTEAALQMGARPYMPYSYGKSYSVLFCNHHERVDNLLK